MLNIIFVFVFTWLDLGDEIVQRPIVDWLAVPPSLCKRHAENGEAAQIRRP